jgi:site-specific recombinase XerD
MQCCYSLQSITLKLEDGMKTKPRSVVTQKGHHAGRPAPNRGRRFPAEVLSAAEVRGLLQACSSRGATGVRNRALISLLYRGGLRLGEALSLYPKDVDAEAGTVTVLHGKGDKRRVVGVDPGGFAILQLWSDKRRTLGLSSRQPLFCTLQGQRMHGSYVRTLLPRLAAKAGVEKRVHPHGLRHSHAYELATEGVPLPIIQAQLGHSGLSTTERYLRHVAPRQVIEAMRARSWKP